MLNARLVFPGGITRYFIWSAELNAQKDEIVLRGARNFRTPYMDEKGNAPCPCCDTLWVRYDYKNNLMGVDLHDCWFDINGAFWANANVRHRNARSKKPFNIRIPVMYNYRELAWLILPKSISANIIAAWQRWQVEDMNRQLGLRKGDYGYMNPPQED